INVKLQDLGFNLCTWTVKLLSDSPQKVRLGDITSSTLMLSTTRFSRGCVLSPVLYVLFTNDCAVTHNSNTIINFTDDTTITGLITEHNETAYREEGENPDIMVSGQQPPSQCLKTKEMVLDFRRTKGAHTPVFINRTPWRGSAASGSLGSTSTRT
ncbi:hypothetical protein LDENG_00260450, partial [Lucifuga dentata]